MAEAIPLSKTERLWRYTVSKADRFIDVVIREEILGNLERGFRGRPKHCKRLLVYMSKCCFPVSIFFPKKMLSYMFERRSRVICQNENVALAHAKIVPIHFSAFSERLGQLVFKSMQPLQTMAICRSKLNYQLEVHRC